MRFGIRVFGKPAKAKAKVVVAGMSEEKGHVAVAEIEAAGGSGAGKSMVGFGYVFVRDGMTLHADTGYTSR
ncbi:hypothetical protein GCM10007362_11830 [Saccharibacillus endophyticus]|uniref:Uncharacterized protein n=1 Tax=Saccharibacillus endophyticus TaxID=2060666 RepID=A0ABQ1ZS26_9BACL|nr:hypothetical protein GCM10007362_11830 [Saccharibacillus endophyticus]